MSFRPTALRTLRQGIYLLAALWLGTTLVPQAAHSGSEVVTDTAPPPPQAEHEPPHRDGYVWGAGHWEWNGRSYVWASGTWILERRAAHWVAARWEQVGTRWHYIAGHWEH